MPGTVLGPETKRASPSDMAPALGELTFQWGEAGTEAGGAVPCAEQCGGTEVLQDRGA